MSSKKMSFVLNNELSSRADDPVVENRFGSIEFPLALARLLASKSRFSGGSGGAIIGSASKPGIGTQARSL
jgi:hypothetical protein